MCCELMCAQNVLLGGEYRRFRNKVFLFFVRRGKYLIEKKKNSSRAEIHTESTETVTPSSIRNPDPDRICPHGASGAAIPRIPGRLFI